MVDLVGFPIVSRQGETPLGQTFVGPNKEGLPLYCVQGQHKAIVLFGHGGPPCYGGPHGGPEALLPGLVQVRPLRDQAWALSWRTQVAPGDIVLDHGHAFMAVKEPWNRNEATTRGFDLVDLKTGRSAVGSVSGPVFRGWELIWFPLPNRPTVIGTFDPTSMKGAADAQRD
jgi:hypothetical protein